MNKKMVGIVAIFTFFISLVCYLLGLKIDKLASHIDGIELEPKKSCINEIKKYFEMEDVIIYTNCLDSLKIKQYGKKVELKNYLKYANKNSIEFIKEFNKVEDFHVTLYQNGLRKEYKGKNITVIECEENNKKILYLGNHFMDEVICKE